MNQNIKTIDITVDGVTLGKTVYLAPKDDFHYKGTVDGHRFTYMLASRATAEIELDKAMRAVAAWKMLLDTQIGA